MFDDIFYDFVYDLLIRVYWDEKLVCVNIVVIKVEKFVFGVIDGLILD